MRLRVQTFESPSNFKIRPRLSCPNSPIPESADLEIHFRDTPPKWIFDPADNPKPYKNSNLQPAVQPALKNRQPKCLVSKLSWLDSRIRLNSKIRGAYPIVSCPNFPVPISKSARYTKKVWTRLIRSPRLIRVPPWRQIAWDTEG